MLRIEIMGACIILILMLFYFNKIFIHTNCYFKNKVSKLILYPNANFIHIRVQEWPYTRNASITHYKLKNFFKYHTNVTYSKIKNRRLLVTLETAISFVVLNRTPVFYRIFG